MTWGIYKDGKLKKTYKSVDEARIGLQKLQPFSFDTAKREGWSIKKIRGTKKYWLEHVGKMLMDQRITTIHH